MNIIPRIHIAIFACCIFISSCASLEPSLQKFNGVEGYYTESAKGYDMLLVFQGRNKADLAVIQDLAIKAAALEAEKVEAPEFRIATSQEYYQNYISGGDVSRDHKMAIDKRGKSQSDTKIKQSSMHLSKIPTVKLWLYWHDYVGSSGDRVFITEEILSLIKSEEQ